MYDLAIIGGGPAGVGAGVYASRKQLKTIFITKDFQSQSSVSDSIENWIGTKVISGADLAKSLEGHLRAYAENIIDIKTGELCSKIEKVGEVFRVMTDKGTYEARTILITTGSHRRKLEGVVGADIFEHKGLTYCATCDGPLFKDQDVAVIGGGNAAFETAAQLLAYCKSVTLLNRSDNFRADPITVEAIKKDPKMKILANVVTTEIKGDKFVNGLVWKNTTTNETGELAVKGIFVEIGLIPTTGFASELVKLDNYNHIVADPRNQRTSQEGIWAAGDCTDGLYHQNNIAAGDAIKALEDIYLHLKTRG